MSAVIGIIGAGRVGSALARALHARGHQLCIASRSQQHAQALAAALGLQPMTTTEVLATAGLVIAALADDALAPFAAAEARPAARPGQAIVHCSGALGAEPLAAFAEQGWEVGAWHPLQAFPSRAIDVQPGITWGVTAASQDLEARLMALSTELGGHPRRIAPADKTLYHAAAALAANYAITLAAHATMLLERCGLDQTEALAALLPLLQGNLATLAEVGLPAALTGPLARGDAGTVASHLAALAPIPATAELYRAAGRATLPILAQRTMAAETIAALAKALDPPHQP